MLDLNTARGAHINERLKSNVILWISTVRPDGRPHIVPVWFLWDGESILIFSKPDQKVRNLRENPNVMLALDDTNQGDDPIAIEGQATLLDEPSISLMPSVPEYANKYKAQMQGLNLPAETMAQSYSQPIRITPTRVLGL